MQAHVAGTPATKPRLRGVSHQYAFFAFLVANAILFAVVGSGPPQIAVLVYGGSLAFLYGVSSLYHRRTWGAEGRQRMRSLDHSAIFVLIAGSYTPLFLLLPTSGPYNPLLITWALAIVGVVKSLVWRKCPKALTALLAIAVGWSVVNQVVELTPIIGQAALWLLVVSGITYSIGGVVYGVKRPDPVPRIFGYHEVFHGFVILGSLLHFGHVLLVLRSANAFEG